LDSYISHLKETGSKFPVSQFGDVNISLISELCGFNRQVFGNNKGLQKILEDAVNLIGTTVIEGQDTESRLDGDIKKLRKQLSDAKRDLALAEETIEALQKQLMDRDVELKRSEEVNREASESLEHMISTGRRFTL
jgi:septal ring factor EnvC (AmiA/AmiB activator)